MVNAYLNMKLSNPEDKRPMWKFKFSCIDHGVEQSHELGLRKRKRTRRISIVGAAKFGIFTVGSAHSFFFLRAHFFSVGDLSLAPTPRPQFFF